MNNTKENYVKLVAGSFITTLIFLGLEICGAKFGEDALTIMFATCLISGVYLWGFINGHDGATEYAG